MVENKWTLVQYKRQSEEAKLGVYAGSDVKVHNIARAYSRIRNFSCSSLKLHHRNIVKKFGCACSCWFDYFSFNTCWMMSVIVWIKRSYLPLMGDRNRKLIKAVDWIKIDDQYICSRKSSLRLSSHVNERFNSAFWPRQRFA